MKKSPVCPRCKNKMVLRSGAKGDFFGCSTYPRCNYTTKKMFIDHVNYNKMPGDVLPSDFNTRKG